MKINRDVPPAKYKHVLYYGMAMALLVFFLKWLELRFTVIEYSFEIYVVFIALVFTVIGIWVAVKLTRPRIKIISDSDIKPGLSRREVEVLQLMAEGLSNKEIASRLFVSQNTIKTHTSNIFEKLQVGRRAQAVDRAKKLGILT